MEPETAARKAATLPCREWRLAILALLQAPELGKEQASGPLLFALKKDLQARVSIGYW